MTEYSRRGGAAERIQAVPVLSEKLSENEERILLFLARQASSVTLPDIIRGLEMERGDLRNTLRRLYRRRFIVISRGIRSIPDTYLLSGGARLYVRHHLLHDTVDRLPIETLTAANQRR